MTDQDTCAATSGAAPGQEPPQPAPPAADTVGAESLAELAARAAKADENWDRYVRAAAELENFRKRAARDKAEAVQHANEGLIRRLLPVLDNFDMALAAAEAPNTDVASIRTGVAMIHGQLRQALADAGVQEVCATGQAFDPHLHEAVSQMESADVPEGHVLHQVRKGYRLYERLVRPASVVVARPPAA